MKIKSQLIDIAGIVLVVILLALFVLLVLGVNDYITAADELSMARTKTLLNYADVGIYDLVNAENISAMEISAEGASSDNINDPYYVDRVIEILRGASYQSAPPPIVSPLKAGGYYGSVVLTTPDGTRYVVILSHDVLGIKAEDPNLPDGDAVDFSYYATSAYDSLKGVLHNIAHNIKAND